MKPWSYDLAGRLDELELRERRSSRTTPLGDPHVRPLWVYVPPGYDADHEPPLPVDLRDPGPDRAARHVAQPHARSDRTSRSSSTSCSREASCPPAILVYVDAWTSLGGSQFIDSPGTGRYHTYIVRGDRRRSSDARYRTLAGAEHRGISRQVERRLRRDGQPDAAPGRLRRPRHPRGRRALRDVLPARLPRGPCARCATTTTARSTRFWEDFRSRPAFSKDSDHTAPERLLHGRLLLGRRGRDGRSCPTTPPTGELRPEIWERWLAWDPVRMAPERADALRSLKAIYVDCGSP